MEKRRAVGFDQYQRSPYLAATNQKKTYFPDAMLIARIKAILSTATHIVNQRSALHFCLTVAKATLISFEVNLYICIYI